MPQLAPTARTRVRRAPKRAVYDRAAIEGILDEALYCHLGFVHDEQPYVIPTLHARVGDVVYVHGSTASRAVRALGRGIAACLTVTLADGVVLARSAFHHSLNYRCAMLLGTMELVTGREERLHALEAFTEQLVPGRWDAVRPPNKQELKGTSVLRMALAEASAKVRTGPPVDDDEDLALPVWAGVVPLRTVAGAPEPDLQLEAGAEVPEHVAAWRPTAARR
jgi:nitroimidazol reductase NimA-like FMN-containing flavoprotein (pyridoxamine 5'-phosphate oxidase superfamily)